MSYSYRAIMPIIWLWWWMEALCPPLISAASFSSQYDVSSSSTLLLLEEVPALSPPNCFRGEVVEHDVAKLEFIRPVVVTESLVLASYCALPPPKID